jgi:hypothetical protein
MTKWRLIIDEGEWLRLFDEDDKVVATELITGPIAELIGHLSPGDTVSVMADDVPATTHRCEGPEVRSARLQLALLTDDMPGYQLIVDEVGNCHRCWRGIAHWAISLVVGDRSLRAGSNEAAAGFVQSELVRNLMPQ